MSESRTETVADIVADMREQAQILDLGNDDVKVFADRIEAAWKREREGGGNAAKLREALNTIVKWCDNELLDPKFELATIAQYAEAALSEPARNCDRFATRKGAWAAYEALRPRPRWKEGDGLPAFSVVRFDEWVWLPPREDGLYMRQEYEPTLFDQDAAEGATESGAAK